MEKHGRLEPPLLNDYQHQSWVVRPILRRARLPSNFYGDNLGDFRTGEFGAEGLRWLTLGTTKAERIMNMTLLLYLHSNDQSE